MQNLKNLKTLILFKNQITKINGDLNLINLQHFELSSNKIVRISDSTFNKCFNLIKLDLSFNKLKSLKINKNHSNLREIRLNNNEIVDLKDIELPSSLEHIDLSNNHIRIFNLQGNFSKLINLDLTNNEIELWTKESTYILPNLEKLLFSFNQLKNFAEPFRQFKNIM